LRKGQGETAAMRQRRRTIVKKKIRDSFKFYRSYAEAVNCLPDADQLLLYRAVTDYALNGVETELEGVAKGFFALIKAEIDCSF
jgi:hypothetical protein